MADEGVMRITLVEAHLTHNTEVLGKMDPFVKFVCRDQEYRSYTAKDHGKHPKWTSQHWEFRVHYLGDDVEFHVFDDDVGKDESIGQGSSKLYAFAHNGGIDEWFEI